MQKLVIEPIYTKAKYLYAQVKYKRITFTQMIISIYQMLNKNKSDKNVEHLLLLWSDTFDSKCPRGHAIKWITNGLSKSISSDYRYYITDGVPKDKAKSLTRYYAERDKHELDYIKTLSVDTIPVPKSWVPLDDDADYSSVSYSRGFDNAFGNWALADFKTCVERARKNQKIAEKRAKDIKFEKSNPDFQFKLISATEPSENDDWQVIMLLRVLNNYLVNGVYKLNRYQVLKDTDQIIEQKFRYKHLARRTFDHYFNNLVKHNRIRYKI